MPEGYSVEWVLRRWKFLYRPEAPLDNHAWAVKALRPDAGVIIMKFTLFTNQIIVFTLDSHQVTAYCLIVHKRSELIMPPVINACRFLKIVFMGIRQVNKTPTLWFPSYARLGLVKHVSREPRTSVPTALAVPYVATRRRGSRGHSGSLRKPTQYVVAGSALPCTSQRG